MKILTLGRPAPTKSALWSMSAFAGREAIAEGSSSTTDRLPTSRQIGGSTCADQNALKRPILHSLSHFQTVRSAAAPGPRIALFSVVGCTDNCGGGRKLWKRFERVMWIQNPTACW